MNYFTCTPADRAAAAMHEAGHAVAAVLLGGTITEVTLDPVGGGLTQFTGVRPGAVHEVSYAGPYAEARHRAGHLPTLGQIRAVFRDCAGHDHAALIASGNPWPRGIESAVEYLLPHIARVALALNTTGRLDHAGVTAALGFPAGDRPVLVASLCGSVGTIECHMPRRISPLPPVRMR
ncbi:UNVERIFIED_CONTAM: peptidase M50B-like protein [Williamsia faeni]